MDKANLSKNNDKSKENQGSFDPEWIEKYGEPFTTTKPEFKAKDNLKIDPKTIIEGINQVKNKLPEKPLRIINGDANDVTHIDLSLPKKTPIVFQRDVDLISLTGNIFAFDLFEFKYDKTLKSYELSALYYEGMRTIINENQYHKRQLTKDSHVYIEDNHNIIDEVTPEMINDAIRRYVDSFPKVWEFQYNGGMYNIPVEALRNIYLRQQNNIINNRWLTNIQAHETPILKDTETTAYFVYNNGIAEVTADGIHLRPFTELDNRCVWRDQIIGRDFKYQSFETRKKGEFEKFCGNISNGDEKRYNALCSALGYLLHNHFSPIKGQAVIFYDEALAAEGTPNGGTGKGVLVQGLSQFRKTAKIDGKNYKSDDKFKWSNVTPSTQLVWIDETNKKFDFKDLFSCLTDGWQVERKHQNKFDIAPEDSPKVVICSNTIMDNEGSSTKRRQFIVELSDHYSKQIIQGTEEPIKDQHGGILFSKDWDKEQWSLFDSFMLECVRSYLENGLQPYELVNVGMNLLKQKTSEEFVSYIEADELPQPNTEFYMKPCFDAFKSEYYGDDAKLGLRTYVKWIKLYCKAKNIKFEKTGKDKTGTKYKMVTW